MSLRSLVQPGKEETEGRTHHSAQLRHEGTRRGGDQWWGPIEQKMSGKISGRSWEKAPHLEMTATGFPRKCHDTKAARV